MNIKQSNKKIPMKSFPPWERPLFLIIMTFVGGYMNAYTYMTRNKILANMHTANMSKLGINIALGEFRYALHFFAPIISCMLGVVFSNWIRHIVTKNKYNKDWRIVALLLESIGLFCIGLIPLSTPDYLVTNLVSFFMGYQLYLFRKCLDISHNTTICTGNIRTVGELLFDALEKRSLDSIKKLLIFVFLTFSFALGTIPGTLISLSISTKAVWVCSFILLGQALWMNKYNLKYEK